MGELPHGYTLADLAGIARRAAGSPRYWVVEYSEARDIAACALIERLYAGGPMPTRGELFDHARNAIGRERDSVLRNRGLRTNFPRDHSHAFARYWISVPTETMEDKITDRIACRQVFWALSETQRDALAALGWHETWPAAAASLGISVNALKIRVSSARKHARALWHWPEPPAPMWGRDRRVPGGVNRRSTIMNDRKNNRRKAARKAAA